MACFKTTPDPKLKKNGFLVTAYGEGSLIIKAFILMQDEKTTTVDHCGDLIDRVASSSCKYVVQAIDKSGICESQLVGTDGRAAIVTLNSSQREISILELM